MAALSSYYDSRLKRRYIAGGYYPALLKSIRFKKDTVEAFADKLALIIQHACNFNAKDNQKHQNLDLALSRLFGSNLEAALLYDSSSFKNTLVTGFVKNDKVLYYIKLFKTQEDVIFHKYQSDFIQEHFTGPFLTTPVIKSLGNGLVYEYAERARNVNDDDHIEKKLIHLSAMLVKEKSTRKHVSELMPLDMGVLCQKTSNQELHERLIKWLVNQTGIMDIIPVHGDMTRDNLFVNEDEKHILVDYERSGWHVAYYDYFHYLLQHLARGSTAPNINTINFETDYPRFKQALIVYLIDQLHHDLSNKVHNNDESKITSNLIHNKARWLDELLSF